jgi:hypothetical protein
VVVGEGGAEKAEGAHFTEDRGVAAFVAEGFEDAWGEALLAVDTRRVADGAFVGGELRVQGEGVGRVEGRVRWHRSVPREQCARVFERAQRRFGGV